MPRKNHFLFAHDSTGFYFSWICLLMVFISTLLSGTGLMVYDSVKMWQKGVSESLTIQIDTYDDNGQARGNDLETDIEKTLSILRTTPGILGATVVDDEHMAELMAPWIGTDINVQNLPLPTLIDVAIDEKNPPFLEQLKMDLSVQVPHATIDSHRIWLSNLIKLSHHVIEIVVAILFLLTLTIIFTVIYTTKASLKIQEYVIRLVHMMGAKDLYMTNRYAIRTFQRTLAGGIMGFIAAVPLLFSLGYAFQGFSNSIFITSFSITQWGILLLNPVFLAVVAFITSFKTVLNYLRKFV